MCSNAAANNQPPDFVAGLDSLYLYPWKGNVFVIQGNGGILSHNVPSQEFAYDFDTEPTSDNRAYAARSGIVIEVEQRMNGHKGGTDDCTIDKAPPATGVMENPNGCQNNKIRIRHIDGSIAEYFHIEHHGAMVKLDQYVERGQQIAMSGNAGNSGVRHIHFDVHAAGNPALSIKTRFDGGSHACSKPHYADWPDSTLGLGYSFRYRTEEFTDYQLHNKR